MAVYKGDTGMRDIAVHPVRGYLFLTNWWNNATIFRMNLDGTQVVPILADLGWPNSVTIDYQVGGKKNHSFFL